MRFSFSTGLLFVGKFSLTKWVLRVHLYLKMRSLSAYQILVRSACICWQKEEGKGEPWNVNHLILYYSLDTHLWTAEGTNLV